MEGFKYMLKSIAEENSFIDFQTESYNDFIKNGLQDIIDEIGEIRPLSEELGDFKIELGKIRLGKPSIKEADGSVRYIMPLEARLRNLTYAAPIFLEFTITVNGNEQESTEVKIGDLPVMVKSSICPLSKMNRKKLIEAGEDPEDPGGYFIINGTERVLVLIEEISPNKIVLEKKRKGPISESVRINSKRRGWSQQHIISRKNDGLITISYIGNIRNLPIVILMRALGLESDKGLIDAIGAKEHQEDIYANLYESDITTRDEALEYIGKQMRVYQKEYRKERAEQIIDKYLLPHIGQGSDSRMKKAEYLGIIANKLIRLSKGELSPDDIDHYSNKRLQTAGDLLKMSIRSGLLGKWGLILRIKFNYQKIAKRGKIPSISTVVESNVLTNNVNSSLATGLWVGGRTGVSQRLERTNFTRTIPHLRNVVSPLSTTQEHFEARELHATQWGRLCPAETPEGPTIGLRKYLALLAEISKKGEAGKVKKILKKYQ